MEAKGYKSLRVYQDAHRLAVEVHQMSLTLPKFEMYEEGSQIRRSSKAIPANIVEGYGRRMYKAEYLRFLVYAVSSCDETKEHLELLRDCDSLSEDHFKSLWNGYMQLGRDLYFYVQSVFEQHKAGFSSDKPEQRTLREATVAYVVEGMEDFDWDTWLQEHAPSDE
jgi:four helix bundle protein